MMEFFDRKFAAKLEQISLVRNRLAHRVFTGDNYLSRRGHSPEFHDYREYDTGDELRGVDWNVYARLGKLYCREYEQESELHLRIMIDCSSSMENKFFRTLQLAACMGYCALCGGCRVEVQPLREDLHESANNNENVFSGRGHFTRLCALLADFQPRGGNDFGRALSLHSNCPTAGKGVRVVLSDFFWAGGTDAFLRQTSSLNDEVHFIQQLAVSEISPLVHGRKLLIDSEDNSTLKIDGGAISSSYRRELNDYCENLHRMCCARGCGYVLLDTGMELEEAVLHGLSRCGLLL